MEKTATQFYKRQFKSLINVQKIVTVHYQELSKGYVSNEEQHDFWEMIYADKQEIKVLVNGESYLVKQGQTVFLPPNCAHYVSSEKKEPNIFILSFVCKSKSIDFFAEKTLTVPEHYRYLLENIISEAEKTFVIPDFDPHLRKLELRDLSVPGGEQIIKNSLELLLVYLFREGASSQQTFLLSKANSSQELQDEIIRILSENLYEKFSLSDLCEKLHYGKTHLCTLFKEKTGSSVYATFLKMKISESKKLIRAGATFNEIFERLQFDSLPHFHRLFKRHTGMTPNEYKKSIQKRKQ